MTTLPAPRALPGPVARALRRYLVELRKLLDTPSALAILAITLFAGPAAIALSLFLEPATAGDPIGLAGQALGLVAYLVPLLAILSITGEWRLRTALSTYTLDSARTAVLAAKGAALLTVVAASVIVVAAAATAATLALGQFAPPPTRLLGAAVGMLAGTAGIALVGAGFGAALLNTPLAIVLYLSLPPAVPQLLGRVPQLAGLVPFLDIHTPLLTLIRSGDQAHPAASTVAALLWIAVPVAVGFVRNATRHVS